MESIREMLENGRPKSLGRTEEAVKRVLEDPHLLPELIACLSDPSDLVRMRASDGLEKVFRHNPQAIAEHLDQILDRAWKSTQPSVQWHVAQILGQADLRPDQFNRAREFVLEALDSSTDWLVLVHCMDSLVAMAQRDPALSEDCRSRLISHCLDNRPAVSKRATKLLNSIKK